MLQLTIPEREFFDERTSEFVKVKATTLLLEHSLISISKWESRWEKPFLGKDNKTSEEIMDYIRCMTINSSVSDETYLGLTNQHITTILNYINKKMTATWFSEEGKHGGRGEIVTSELIYYWMTAFNIPFDPCEKWHLNRLLTLVRVCSAKNAPPKKRSKREMMSQRAALNAKRRAQFNSKG